jgi:hypothetical protein
MLSAAHTIISLPFGLALTNPFVAFFGAFLMHLVCDMLLHWNIYPHQYKRYPVILVGADILAGIAASFFILHGNIWNISIWAAIAGGNMPDVLHALWSFLEERKKKSAPAWIQWIFNFHEDIQWETENPLIGGLSQIILCTIAIAITLLWN